MTSVAEHGTIRHMTVQDLRVRKGWTQRTLADAANVGVRTIIRAEKGENISPLKQQRIATALGVDRHDLFAEAVA